MTETLAVGIMSGTSLDGVSTALVGITDAPPQLEVRLAAFHQESYSAAERTQIVDTIARGGSRDLALLHVALGERFAAAALQRAQAGPQPILLRIETRAGHGAGTPTSKLIEVAADRWAFLVKNLGMDLPVEE